MVKPAATKRHLHISSARDRFACRVYKAVQALSDASAPGMAAAGSMRDFGSCAPARLLPADRQNGHWHNYMVGVESQVGTTSMDSMWPNRVRPFQGLDLARGFST